MRGCNTLSIAALRETPKSLGTISRSLFGNAWSNESDSVLDFVSDHVRVKLSLLLVPKRNIIFADEEKEHVLRIFDVIEPIKGQLPEESEIKTKYTVAEIKKKYLKIIQYILNWWPIILRGGMK
jgi:hypothetical protein